MKNNKTNAKAIVLGDRFFCGFGKGGRVKTAWSLAGAKLFLLEGADDKLETVTTKLTSKGTKFEVQSIQLACS
ncbi:hypothetical protein AB4560_01615 [Vibrio sp. 10N.222.51.C12]|uniref:hypothetical protein n=1 Tax=Vibrio sp. 10N.222.51.C12 TaxID=3229622 RepID=UPI0035517927